MSSLDDLVDQLLNQHAAKSAASGMAQSTISVTPAAGSEANDSFEAMLRQAGVARQAAAEGQAAPAPAPSKEGGQQPAAIPAEIEGQMRKLRIELEQLRMQNAVLKAENDAMRQAKASAQLSPEEAQPASAPATLQPAAPAGAGADGSGTATAFPWKRHIGAVEESLRKKNVAVAEPLIKTLVDVADCVGSEAAVRVRLMAQLGTIHLERGQFAEAEEVLSRAEKQLPGIENLNHAEKVASAFCLDALAQCFQEKEDFDQAEKLRRKAVMLSEEALGMEHPDAAFIRDRLETMRSARQIANIGKDEGSKTVLDKLSEEYNAAVSQGQPPVPEARPSDGYAGLMFEKFLSMAKTAITQKNDREAENALRSAMEKADGVSDSDARKCEAYRLYAEVLERQGKDNEARLHLEKSLRLAYYYIGANDPQVADALSALGKVHSRLNDVGLAKNYLKQALGLYTLALGKEHEKTVAAQADYDDFIDKLKSERQWKEWSN